MNQPQDAIRPRRRRRLSITATNPAVARAEQRTRVLIRVPAAAVPAARATGQQPAPTIAHSETKDVRKETSSATSGLRALLNDTTARKPSGSPQPMRAPEQPARTLPTRPTVKPAPEAVPRQVEPLQRGATTPLESNQQFRIDAAHGDWPGPHSASDAWLERKGSLLTDFVQRRSLLAMALIIAGVIGIVMMLHVRTQQHALRPENDAGANSSRSDVKSEAGISETATSAGVGQTAQRSSAAPQSTVNGAMREREPNSGPQYRADDLPVNNPSAASERWKAPAGANIPARIEPIGNAQQPAAGPISPNSDGGRFYSTYRETAQPNSSANSGSSGGSTSAAAFEGSINNPVQFSR